MKGAPTESIEKIFATIAPKVKGSLIPARLAALPEDLLLELERPEVLAIYATPQKTTARLHHYEFTRENPLGVDLKNGQVLIILVPNGDKAHLADIVLGHRKREQFWGDTSAAWDTHGAYTEVLVFDAKTQQWKSWKDPLGHDPVKYAERRKTVEIEHLGMWPGMLGDVHPLAVKLISRGKGDPAKSLVTECSLDVITRPEVTVGTQALQNIYTHGTAFADYKLADSGIQTKHRFGGGKDKHAPQFGFSPQGGYPHAVALRAKRGYEPFPLTEKVTSQTEFLDSEGRLHLRLPSGKKILSLELSVGCKWTNNPVGPEKQPIGIAGGHKLDAYLISSSGESDRFISSANVGAEGVLTGGPSKPDYVTQSGDEIVLVCPKGTIYLMGWRILLEDAGPKDITTVPVLINSVASAVHGAQHVPVSTAGISTNPKNLSLQPTGETAGGTQGGKWHIDKASGDRYFLKGYEKHAGAKDRCATEYIAGSIYAKMDILVPETVLVDGKVASKEVKGLKQFSHKTGSKKAAAREFFANSADVKAGFVVDAWLANWDVFGLDYDNLLQHPSTGRFFRTDFGGTLFFRGMGADKPQFNDEAVTEVKTMRDPEVAREAGVIFKDLVTEADIKNQIQKLVAVMTDYLITEIVQSSGISNPDQIIQILKKRRDWLQKQYLAK